MKFSLFNKKEFPGATVNINYPISHSPMQGKKLHQEGYTYNVIVYRCVDSLIKAVKGIKIQLKQGDNIIEDHAVLDLLNKPNPKQGKATFLTEAFVNRLVIGELYYVTSENARGEVLELWNLDPLEMLIEAGTNGLPRAYIHKVNGNSVVFPVDQVTGKSDVFYWRGYNPLDKWRGLSPLMAASLAADSNNAGLRWNYSLLKKGARPSGIIKFKGTPSEDVINRLRKYFKDTMQGEYNAGEVPILTGEGEYQEIGKSPKDMDFIKTDESTVGKIAMAYGVPLPLVLNDAATFNNYKEAKELFYTDSVLPLFEEYLEGLSNWLLPKYNLSDAKLIYDKTTIPALEGLRERQNESMTKLVNGGIISPDEARTGLGYEPRGGLADELFMPASVIPIEDNNDISEEDDEMKMLLSKQGLTKEEITAILGDS